MADLSMALTGRFTDHHALMCRLHLDRIKVFGDAVDGPGCQDRAAGGPLRPRGGAAEDAARVRGRDRGRLAGRDRPGPAPALRHRQQARLLGDRLPGELHEREERARAGGPATAAPTSSRCSSRPPGPRSGYPAGCRPGSAAWSASSAAPRNKGAQKRAITAIAHTLLKIAYSVLKTGTPYTDLGADFYARRESPDARQDYLMRQLQKLNPGCVITITPAEAA